MPQHVRDKRRGSLPDVLKWNAYTEKKDMPSDTDQREWARGIWNEWFDQVFPPEPEQESDATDDDADEVYEYFTIGLYQWPSSSYEASLVN